jgi:hypothetical protein
MNRQGSGLTLMSMTPDPADEDFSGTATDGAITVNDTYVNPGNSSTGSQTGSGPNGTNNNTASISFTPASGSEISTRAPSSSH